MANQISLELAVKTNDVGHYNYLQMHEAYFARWYEHAKQHNRIGDRSIMPLDVWQEASDDEKTEYVQIAILTTHSCEYAQHEAKMRDTIRQWTRTIEKRIMRGEEIETFCWNLMTPFFA